VVCRVKLGDCAQVNSICPKAAAPAASSNAALCFDPLHLVKLANEALEVLRRVEVVDEPALIRTRYHWLKDLANWIAKEIDLHWLRHKGLKTARAWRLKQRLRDILRWRADPYRRHPQHAHSCQLQRHG